tara:strand:+ start:355 stop:834 length:480 start_codon:yes stop_codon:yes gene_type:complete
MNLSKDKLKKIAKEREDVHQNHASSRPLSKDYEYIGLVGESEFANQFNFKLDQELRPSGDGGRDFNSPLGLIDVKTARKAFNLIVEEGKVDSDIYVLAQYHEKTESASLLGWAYKKEVLEAPRKDFGYKIINHYINKRNLRTIDSLKKLLEIKVDNFPF